MEITTVKIEMEWSFLLTTGWKVSKYGVFSAPYFPAFGLNTGKYGPEKTPYLDTFHTVNSTYNCSNTSGFKHITRLRLLLNHLGDHKFKQGFLDSLNPNWSCSLDIETTCHFLLQCPNFRNERSPLQNNVSGLIKKKLSFCELLLSNFSFMVLIH